MDEAQAVLAEVLSEVLGSFAFSFGEVVEPGECPQPDEPALHATMSVSGGVRASVGLAAPVTLCGEFAANVLGVETVDEAAEAHASDALRELLNITCGRFLTSLYGEEPVFDLGPPRAKELDAAGWADLAGEAEVLAFLVEEKPLLAHVRLEATKR